MGLTMEASVPCNFIELRTISFLLDNDFGQVPSLPNLGVFVLRNPIVNVQ